MTREPPAAELDPTEPLWTSEDVMNYLRISRTTLWTLVKKKGLPAFKIPGLGEWRYRRSEIDAWIAGQRNAASER